MMFYICHEHFNLLASYESDCTTGRSTVPARYSRGVRAKPHDRRSSRQAGYRSLSRIPESKGATPCSIGGNPPVTLDFLIDDYILHLQHHVDHILRREIITKYPR